MQKRKRIKAYIYIHCLRNYLEDGSNRGNIQIWFYNGLFLTYVTYAYLKPF